MDYEIEDRMSGFAYFVLGAGIGALLGLLYAPKAGEELRDDVNGWIRDKTRLGRRQARVIQDAIEKGGRSVVNKAHRATGR